MYTNEEIARIINALENAVWAQNWDDRHDDVYDACSDAVKDAAKDAVDLILDLTAEEEPKLYVPNTLALWNSWYICGACEYPVNAPSEYGQGDRFCSCCGRRIKWPTKEEDDENRT